MAEADTSYQSFTSKRDCLKRKQLCKAQTKRFVLDSITRDHPFNSYYQSLMSHEFEDDIRKALSKFDDLTEDRYNLLMIRRFLYRRYAFSLARTVEASLLNDFLRLDHFLPRIALSMPLGFGAVLGAGDLVLWLGAMNLGPSILLWISSLLAVFGVATINARERLGADSKIGWRAIRVVPCSILWTVLFLILAWGFGYVAGLEKCGFHWMKAANIGAVALVTAILAQFFFGSSGSIADPL